MGLSSSRARRGRKDDDARGDDRRDQPHARQHIVTIEDPIEILHADDQCIVNQREVGLDTESFEQALRRALRRDPDVILIGELRDAETAQTALQAAESGSSRARRWLTRSTPPRPSAAWSSSFPRRSRCRSARSRPASSGESSASGYLEVDGGRIAAVEVMVNNVRIADLIREPGPTRSRRRSPKASFFDMQTFTQALIDHVLAGTIDEVVAADASSNRHDFLVALERAKKLRIAAARKAEEDARAPDPSELGIPELRVAEQPSAG